MKSNYQRYYSALKDKDFSSPISQYNSALNQIKTKMDKAEEIINSSEWIEKGLEIIKSSVLPSLKNQKEQIEKGMVALQEAATKVKELVSKLGELEQLENQLSSLGSRWTYTEGGSYSLNDVNNHNNEITNVEQNIRNKETEIDNLISAINNISFEYNSYQSAFTTIMENLKDNTDMEARKAEFLGSIDDDSWYIDPSYAHKAKELLLFDNTTGEILKEGDTINMKVGETRVLTVRVPHNAGRVKQVIRTSAWKPDDSNVVSVRSDINPDPNVVEYVNYKPDRNVWPQDMSILHTNSYDWIITANQEGGVQVSQTCEYKVEENSGTPKAMVDIHVNVTS